MQTPLGAFPQTADAMRLQPEQATRFDGMFRIVNDGAVRLAVAAAMGLSQISPDQFPEANLFHAPGNSALCLRLLQRGFAVTIQADRILPEVGISEVLAYRARASWRWRGPNWTSAKRPWELRLDVPKGYAVAQLTASGLSDYFTSDTPDQDGAELRWSMASRFPTAKSSDCDWNATNRPARGTGPCHASRWRKPIRARLCGNLRRERLPSQPGRTRGLTEIATAFFPSPPAGIQWAFRLSDTDWQARFRVERLPQTVQADVLHLFSIGKASPMAAA